MGIVRSTIKDVAAASGVTAGTVSRALRNDPRVVESTRLRILEAAKRLNYRPNLQARGLQTGRMGALGVYSPTGAWILENAYFSPMLAGLASLAAEDGTRIILYLPPRNGRPDAEVGDAQAREMLDGRVDGSVIFQADVLPTETLVGLRDMGLAVVLLNLETEIPGFSQILANSAERIRESLRWARERGAHKVAVLGLGQGHALNDLIQRELAQLGGGNPVSFHPVAHPDHHDTAALDAALKALSADKPDAVIFNCESHTSRYLALQERGLLPKGAALYSFGATHSSATSSLTGVRYLEADLTEVGRAAYRLFKEAQDRKAPKVERVAWARRVANA